jgi:hypothetical protein
VVIVVWRAANNQIKRLAKDALKGGGRWAAHGDQSGQAALHVVLGSPTTHILLLAPNFIKESTMTKGRLPTLAGLVVVLLLIATTVVFAATRNFRTHLNASFEVPANGSHAQGQAIFKLSKDGNALEYKLNVANIQNVTQAHIHTAAPGVNGPIVAWLYPSAPPQQQIPGRFDGTLAEGTITAANLVGPLAGGSLSDLIALMENGAAYVNVHTNDLMDPPNTGPGDFPGGEIRGNLP